MLPTAPMMQREWCRIVCRAAAERKSLLAKNRIKRSLKKMPTQAAFDRNCKSFGLSRQNVLENRLDFSPLGNSHANVELKTR